MSGGDVSTAPDPEVISASVARFKMGFSDWRYVVQPETPVIDLERHVEKVYGAERVVWR